MSDLLIRKGRNGEPWDGLWQVWERPKGKQLAKPIAVQYEHGTCLLWLAQHYEEKRRNRERIDEMIKSLEG